MALKETKVESEVIYLGKIIDVYKDKVMLPNGQTTFREYIKHCKASCILAKLPNGKFLIEKQFRYPYKEVSVPLITPFSKNLHMLPSPQTEGSSGDSCF